MRLLNFLKYRRKERPLPPIRTVRPPGEARAARRKTAEQSGPPDVDLRKEPTIDPLFDDDGMLEMSRDPQDEDDNPYDTQAWRRDPREGARRVDDMTAINRDSSKGDHADPYDKSVGRKGW